MTSLYLTSDGDIHLEVTDSGSWILQGVGELRMSGNIFISSAVSGSPMALKIQVRDPSGTILGYIPLYAS
jgi:hypothetical protein